MTVFHTLAYSTKVAATPDPERSLLYMPGVRNWPKIVPLTFNRWESVTGLTGSSLSEIQRQLLTADI